MFPRRILHPENRIICSPELSFYAEVERLTEVIREKIMKEVMGKMYFVDLKNTVNDQKANWEQLELILDILRQHQLLQVEGIQDAIHHEMLIHMALSEIDRSYDAIRDLKPNQAVQPLD